MRRGARIIERIKLVIGILQVYSAREDMISICHCLLPNGSDQTNTCLGTTDFISFSERSGALSSLITEEGFTEYGRNINVSVTSSKMRRRRKFIVIYQNPF